MPGDQVHHGGVATVLGDDLVQGGDVSQRLGHLLARELDHPVVHPDPRELAAARCARLGRLVLVVGKHEVRAAAVDLEVDAEQLLRHGRALDVPPRAPRPPRRGPHGVLARLVGLPQREVERVLLVLLPLETLALVHVLQAPVAEAAVEGIRAHAKIDVATGGVGVPAVDERGDVIDDRLDRL